MSTIMGKTGLMGYQPVDNYMNVKYGCQLNDTSAQKTLVKEL